MEPLAANVLADIGTDSVPRAFKDTSHVAHTFDVPSPSVRDAKTHGYLRHTAICDDAAIAAAMGDWVARGLRPSNR
jgi:hypothetical protein